MEVGLDTYYRLAFDKCSRFYNFCSCNHAEKHSLSCCCMPSPVLGACQRNTYALSPVKFKFSEKDNELVGKLMSN